MINDKQLTISSAGNRWAKKWNRQTLYWSELIDKLRTPVRSTETLAEYLRLPKSKQDELKDVGGFVAGTLKDDLRKATSVIGRDLITLDFDNIPAGATDEVLRRIDALGCGYAVYSTRKHEPVKPRLRILFPLDRTVTADEYEPIARKIAEYIGIEMCDPTTFQASRLMYWPSCCSDSMYVFTYGDKPILSADGTLGLYKDWRDISSWAQVPGVQKTHQKLADKQGDPTEKQGVVGAFCRVYDVYQAIAKFLPGVYVDCDLPGRYTYSGGSTTGGAIIYEDGKFLYSHHATDPAGGKLCNAFDLVRYHKFSEMDDDAKPDTPVNKLPSYTAMSQFAIEDKEVTGLLLAERYDRAKEDFGSVEVTVIEETQDWIKKLAVSATTGLPSKTIDNVLIILENDPLLKGKLAFDEFANRGLALGKLPWDDRTERRNWEEADDAGLLHYLENVHKIQISDRYLYAAMTLCAHKNKINDVQDYLNSLEWDGVYRLDTLFIDYLGALDTVYTRAVARKSLTAAVARAMEPGTKYDYMPIISGPQGIGKSTLLRLLGGKWYSDSLATFEGKEAAEMIQGTWVNELGELNGMSKSEVNAVKQFLSKTEDIYREPYGRRTSIYPRRCVFFGTSNDKEYLRDHTGNRRFWPVDVGIQEPIKNVFKHLEDEVPQIWAEAYARWQSGERLYLSGKPAEIALEEQESHRESNAKEGIIREFLSRPIPLDWEKRNIQQRRIYWSGEFGHTSVETMERDRVCAAEVWCECFNKEISFMKQVDAREINSIISSFKEWKRHGSTQRFGCYGTQRGYEKL